MANLIVFTIFLISLAIYLIPAIGIIHHLFKYGLEKDLSKKMSVIFSLTSLILFGLAFILIINTDWSEVFFIIFNLSFNEEL